MARKKFIPKSFTKEQKQAYVKKIRAEWKQAKLKAETDKEANQAFLKANLGQVSYYSFYFVYLQMQSQGLDGFPYIDMKTFNGWKKSGFMVQKGEKSTCDGVVWKAITFSGKVVNKDETIDQEIDFMVPKVYKLFHRTQTDFPQIDIYGESQEAA